jgi:hypothetical protein
MGILNCFWPCKNFKKLDSTAFKYTTRYYWIEDAINRFIVSGIEVIQCRMNILISFIVNSGNMDIEFAVAQKDALSKTWISVGI